MVASGFYTAEAGVRFSYPLPSWVNFINGADILFLGNSLGIVKISPEQSRVNCSLFRGLGLLGVATKLAPWFSDRFESDRLHPPCIPMQRKPL